eukprot:COSAG02_NODE_6283_length_3680_cov_1.881597_3_plen_108_part_00
MSSSSAFAAAANARPGSKHHSSARIPGIALGAHTRIRRRTRARGSRARAGAAHSIAALGARACWEPRGFFGKQGRISKFLTRGFLKSRARLDSGSTPINARAPSRVT